MPCVTGRDVLVAPVLEEAGVAILALRVNPHVEALCHDHHAQRVAHVHLNLRGVVVRRADGVAAHGLELLDLPYDGRLVDRGAQWAEVMVQADAFYLSALAIEPEAMDGVHLDRTYAKTHGQVVQVFAIIIDQGYFQGI